MHRSVIHHLSRLLACAALLAPLAQAAELGDVAVRSYIGQPLAADIELVSLTPEEAGSLQVRLARPDVYRGASITMNPALSSVRMSVVRRDNKSFLHVTTAGAVSADFVHVYVELSVAGRQEVRLATVWLQPDPNPAPPPPAPSPAPVPTPAPLVASTPAAPAAASTRPLRDRTRPAPLPSVHESEIGTPGAIKAAAAQNAAQGRVLGLVPVRDIPVRINEALGSTRSASTPSRPAAAPAKADKTDNSGKVAGASQTPPVPIAQALLPMPPLPLPPAVKRASAPAACTPSGASASECKALDVQSQALSSKLVELESKLKKLQGALNTGSAPVAAPKAAAVTPSASPPLEKNAGPGTAQAATMPAAAQAATTSAAASAAASKPAAADAAAANTKPDGANKLDATAAAVAKPEAAAATVSTEAVSAGSAPPAADAPPVQQRRVLPKLKYKKEKPPEEAGSSTPLIAGGIVAALLAAAGAFYYWRRKKSGADPLKIWQAFRRKKTVAEASADEFKEVPSPKPHGEPAAQI